MMLLRLTERAHGLTAVGLVSALGMILLTACDRQPAPAAAAPAQLHSIKHITTERYEAAGDVSTWAVPTVIIGKERRPVLAASKTEMVLFETLPSPHERTVSLDVEIPEEMRGAPVRLASTLAAEDVTITDQRPRNLTAAPDQVTVAYTLSGDAKPGQSEHVVVYARSAPAEASYSSQPIAVPAGARLRFGIGLDEAEWPSGLPAATFTCTALEAGKETVLFHTEIDPAKNSEQRRWIDSDIDLAPLAGRTIRLRFDSAAVSPSADAPFIFPVWSDPTIYAPEPEDPKRQPIRNLLLISLDTLRPDHLGSYGYERPTSPVIDARIAARGTLFEHAYAQFPGTHGSHMTLFTSLNPCIHGVPGDVGTIGKLRPDASTLAELFRSLGYQTAAYHEDAFIMADTGFARGFGTFVEFKDPRVRESTGQADVTFPSALRWIQTHGDAPWFLFMHTYQVHHPYTPPPGYEQRVAPVHGNDRASRDSALYDGEIRYTDDLLGTFLDGLDQSGASANTLVVLVSDHGELFGEHGLFGHGISLLDDLLHVALILRAPGMIPEGKRIKDDVGLIDVVPTVLELLGLPPPRWAQGRSLVPLLHDHRIEPATLWGELPFRRQISAKTGKYKWVVNRDNGRSQVFDVSQDPHENVNLRAQQPEDASAKILEQWQRNCAAPPRPDAAGKPPKIDPEVRDKLKALGYTAD